MLAETLDPTLHLPSLAIKNFRGIDVLTLPRLGRVSLLAGKNSVGKTSVLNAVSIYAARCRYGALDSVLRNRAELQIITDADGDETLAPDWNALFYGRDMWAKPGISIGPSDENLQLNIRPKWIDTGQVPMPLHARLSGEEVLALEASVGGQQWHIPIDDLLPNLSSRRLRPAASGVPSEIGCESLGTGLPGAAALARFWDDVVIKDEQSFALNALKLILDAPVEWIAVIGEALYRGADRGRRVIVKIDGAAVPIPLQSLGDGAVRIFGIALALANSRNGFLLIDEVENGLHHSIQQDFWKMVLLTAQQYNVQVLATTHSWDAVVWFARAIQDLEYPDGVYIRLEKDDHKMRAVEYSKKNLFAAAKYDIETR